MAGAEVNLYGVGDVDLTALMNTVDLQRVNRLALSLTNYDNTALPAIAAGSLAEVAGAWFKFTAEEAITGWAGVAVGAAYIKLVPAGTDPDTVTAEFTDTAPTWSDAKQGWYGTVAAANHRYIATLIKIDAATYAAKNIYNGRYGERPMRSRSRVTKNNAQSITNNVTTIVQFDDEEYDNLGEFASYKFTALEAGYYFVTASIEMSGVSWGAGNHVVISIYKNGTIHSYGNKAINEDGTNINIITKVTDIVELAATEYIDIRLFHDDGIATRDTVANASSCYFTVNRLS